MQEAVQGVCPLEKGLGADGFPGNAKAAVGV